MSTLIRLSLPKTPSPSRPPRSRVPTFTLTGKAAMRLR
jgi:hypothetical protein